MICIIAHLFHCTNSVWIPLYKYLRGKTDTQCFTSSQGMWTTGTSNVSDVSVRLRPLVESQLYCDTKFQFHQSRLAKIPKQPKPQHDVRSCAFEYCGILYTVDCLLPFTNISRSPLLYFFVKIQFLYSRFTPIDTIQKSIELRGFEAVFAFRLWTQ